MAAIQHRGKLQAYCDWAANYRAFLENNASTWASAKPVDVIHELDLFLLEWDSLIDHVFETGADPVKFNKFLPDDTRPLVPFPSQWWK